MFVLCALKLLKINESQHLLAANIFAFISQYNFHFFPANFLPELVKIKLFYYLRRRGVTWIS